MNVADGAGPFEVLLAVQDLDTALSQLHHRRATLPERAELAATEAALADLARRASAAAEARQGLMERQAELERQIATLNSRRQAIEERLYADRGSAARDLQAMDGEIHHLVARRAELEDAELTLMEEQEPLDAELAVLAAERGPLEETAARLRQEVARAEAEVDARIKEDEQARRAAAARLPTDLADRYETLRARLKGTGAARLVGNHCDGCHLELPSVEVERIRSLPPDTVVTCDQCGRILVRTAPRPVAPVDPGDR